MEILQLGDVLETQAFKLKDGRAAYMVQVRITNQTTAPIYPVQIGLHFPGEEQEHIDWLEPLRVPVQRHREPDSMYECYRFPDGLELPRDEVLNHSIFNHKKLIPKQPMKGWILATGGLMPKYLKHGQERRAILTIIGSDHTEYSKVVTFWIDCLGARQSGAKPKTVALARDCAIGFLEPDQVAAAPSIAGGSRESSLYK